MVDAFALTDRATRVPHQRDNPGTERTTTVTDLSPMTWSPSALAASTPPLNVPDKDEVPPVRAGFAPHR
jgi:hypothetical protein